MLVELKLLSRGGFVVAVVVFIHCNEKESQSHLCLYNKIWQTNNNILLVIGRGRLLPDYNGYNPVFE